MAANDVSVITTCSFCLKPDHAVMRMIAGPGVYICDECVELCSQIVSIPPTKPAGMTSWEEDLDLERVLASLPRMAAVGAQAENNLRHYVIKARKFGATWAAIGASLTMTRQSAWERFSGEE